MRNDRLPAIFNWLRLVERVVLNPAHPGDPYNHAHSMSHYQGRTPPTKTQRRARRKAERRNKRKG